MTQKSEPVKLLKEYKDTNFKDYMHPYIINSTILNSHDTETT